MICCGNADPAFVGARLVADAGNERDQLLEVAAVQFELSDFLARYRAYQIGRLRLDLGNLRAFDYDLSADSRRLPARHSPALFPRHSKPRLWLRTS